MTPFLSGRWSNIFVQTWSAEDSTVLPYLPTDMQPDRWEGNALVSLVALDLIDPRVFGVRIPGSRRLPEISLRVYLKDGRRRGIRHVRQIVPRPFVAGLARFAANEPYMPLPYRREGDEHIIRQGGREHRIGWTCFGEPSLPTEDSFEEFICNRPWIFGKHWTGAPLALRVEHPRWRVWTDVQPRFDYEPAKLFGEHWHRLAEKAPYRTFVAEGSTVEIHALAGLVEGPRAATRPVPAPA
jgi:hypothetical protein